VGKKKPSRRSSGNRNTQPKLLRRTSSKYSATELFMAVVGVLLIVLFVGIVVSSLIGD
jgi:hypothetical protein